MNEFVFESSAWELTMQKLHDVATVSAVQFLTLTEGETDAFLEEAFAELEQRHITLNPGDLPKEKMTGTVGARLALEEKLVKEDRLYQGLAADDPLRLYLEEVAGTPAQGDAQLLAERYAAGDESASAMLVNLSLSKVIQLAGEMTGRGVLLLDLIQEASLGLWQGILSFQEGDFAAHRDWYIRQSLAKAVTMQARTGGLGQKMRKALEDFRMADEALLTQLGRNPTLPEIAAELHVSLEEAEVYEEMLRIARAVEKTTSVPQEDPAEAEQAVEDTAYFQSRQRIMDMLSGITETESQILTLRFGLEGGTTFSARETAEKLGLTEAEVVAAEAAALEKLRTQNKGE